MAERLLPKQKVAGSNPVSRSTSTVLTCGSRVSGSPGARGKLEMVDDRFPVRLAFAAMTDDGLLALEHENWIAYLTGTVSCTSRAR